MSAGSLSSFWLFRYLKEVREELKRVSWPTKEQTIQKTSLVILVSVVVGAYIGALDYIFTELMKLIVR